MKSSFHCNLIFTAAIFAAALLPLSAQNQPTPNQAGTDGPPVQLGPGGPGGGGRGQADLADGRGGGRGGPGGGRGGAAPGTTLAGGPQLSDEAYANFDFSKQEPVLPQRPADELKEFILQPGYQMEAVLADPIIQEPTAVAFDGNGRMFVLEDRGYMKTADADGERDPIGRISLHEDTDNDGFYDKHTVYVDNLVFPRFLVPFEKNSVLTMETDQDEVWKYTDTNNDGVADQRELFTTGLGRSGNVEHQQAFLTWTMDNWMYSTVNAFRIRWTPNGILREDTGSNGAQWGLTQDDDGKQWFQGGASGTPAYFQFPIVYGNINVGSQWDNDFTIPWGAPVRVADMQGGMSSVRMPDGTLNRVTGSAGNDIVRAHRMPADLQGEYLYGEPVARIVRRIHPVNDGGVTVLENAYKWNEFIKSTDPLFRPVDMATAPDGTVYIVDMYRGIIQEAQWSGQGTYLRARIEQYELDKAHSMGRVWRLSYQGMPRDTTQPRMNDETPAQLVAHLSHPNGWWRDTAQRLLVLAQDRSVVPALQALVRNSDNLVARFHALWTLEGLGALDAALVREALDDSEPRMQIQAIRASETLYKAGDKSFDNLYATLARSPNADVSIQALLTMNHLKVPTAELTAKAAQDTNRARGVQAVAAFVINPSANSGGRGGPGGGGGPQFDVAEQAIIDRGATIYNELCFTCHGSNGLGAPNPDGSGRTLAPSLAGNQRVTGHPDYIVNVLLHGLNGPIPGTAFNDVMVSMGENGNQWIADVASFVRNSFGNSAGFVSETNVAALRAGTSSRNQPWTSAELAARVPQRLSVQGNWQVTASHNAANARYALADFNTWSANTAQEPGPIWYQIELPDAANLSEIGFTTSAGGGRGGRGGPGGGRGAFGRGGPGGRGGADVIPASVPAEPVATPPTPERVMNVEVSASGTTWTSVGVLRGPDGSRTLALNQPTAARFIRVTQQEGPDALSLGNIRLYQMNSPTD